MTVAREREIGAAPDAAWACLCQLRPRIGVDLEGGPQGVVRVLDLDDEARAASFFVSLRVPGQPGGAAGTARVEVRPRGREATLAVAADLAVSGPAAVSAVEGAGQALLERLAGVVERRAADVAAPAASRRRPALLGGLAAALAAAATACALVWRRRR